MGAEHRPAVDISRCAAGLGSVVDEKASRKHLLWSPKKEENLKFDLKDGLCPEVTKVEQQFLDKLVEPEAEADDDQEGDGVEQQGGAGEADADGDLGQGVLGVEGGRARCLVFRLGNRPRGDRLHPTLAEPIEADVVPTPTTLAANFDRCCLLGNKQVYLPRVSTVINIFNRHFFTTVLFSSNF